MSIRSVTCERRLRIQFSKWKRSGDRRAWTSFNHIEMAIGDRIEEPGRWPDTGVLLPGTLKAVKLQSRMGEADAGSFVLTPVVTNQRS